MLLNTNQKHHFCRESVQLLHFVLKFTELRAYQELWRICWLHRQRRKLCHPDLKQLFFYPGLRGYFQSSEPSLKLRHYPINGIERERTFIRNSLSDLFSFTFIGPQPNHCLALSQLILVTTTQPAMVYFFELVYS